MGQIIGTIIFIVLALVAIAAVLNFILGALGIVLALLPLLIKLALFGGALYVVWLLFRKPDHSDER
jgi:hypothetical protein